jgi:hypothetical protein
VLKDMNNPAKIFSDLDLNHTYSSPTKIPQMNAMNNRDAMYFSSLFSESKKGELSFKKALNLVYSDAAKEAGLEMKHPHLSRYDLPNEIQEILNSTLKEKYKNREEEKDVQTFMNWYSDVILERWKSTAIDHERLFDYHDPSVHDKRLMSILWTIREGKLYTQYNKEEHYLRRLPGVLQAMLEDGIIKEEQIDPPLKATYLKPNEVLSVGGKNILTENAASLVSLVMEKSPANIATKVEMNKMLPFPGDERLPIHLENDLSSLGEVLDSSKKYFTLFKGNHTLFITSEEYYPNGSQGIGDIHRLTLLPQGTDPKEGKAITLLGQRFNITKHKSYKTQRDLEDSIFDSNSDDLPVNSYNVVVDITPKEFKEKYFKDFMAHVLIHRPNMELKGLLEDLNQIEKLNEKEISCHMGDTGRVYFKTFELGNKFSFQIKNWNDAMPGEASFISKTLIDYIKDVGLPVFIEPSLDEHGRYLLNKKLEDRVFFKENFGKIADSLKGEGLPKVLCHVLIDRKYDSSHFTESEKPCEYCGKNYMTGSIYRPDLKEQWFNGFRAEDLHALAEHPHTFKFTFDNLKKIKRTIEDAKDYTPAFFAYPQIMPELREFEGVFDEYGKAAAESYRFWNDTQGGVRAEEEELEEDAGLRELRDLETSLNEKERLAHEKAEKYAVKLQEKYDVLSGNKSEINPERLVGYWAQQLSVYDIYKTTAPKMLGE